VKEAVGNKSKTSVVPTEKPQQPVTEDEMETKIRGILDGKVGKADLESVVKGLWIAAKTGKTGRLVDGLRLFSSAQNSEESEKAYIYMLGAATLKAERDELRAAISKDTGIPEKELTTYELFERYINREDDDVLMNRIANLVAYSDYVQGAINVLSGNPVQISDTGQEDMKSELAAIDYNTIEFSGIPEPLRNLLAESGCDEETFNGLSPEAKRSALSCLGV